MTIYKYDVKIDTYQEVEMPQDAQILDFQFQEGYNKPVIWALVNPDKPKITRKFLMIGTGHHFYKDIGVKYIGSIQMYKGSLVNHLFEIVS